MIVDGTSIARDLQAPLSRRTRKFFDLLGRKPNLAVVYVGHDPSIDNFVRIKKRTGDRTGIETKVFHFPETLSENQLKKEIKKISNNETCDAVIVQLPLPANFDTDNVLENIPFQKDADVLNGTQSDKTSLVNPPVSAAVAEIFLRHSIKTSDKEILIIGKGRLVGRPVYRWLVSLGARPAILDKKVNIFEHLRRADIVISGAGSPHLIRPNMIKKGAVLIDAGTSEISGEILGDIDLDCAAKASVFAAVPGGIGPITVVKLFDNVITLAEIRYRNKNIVLSDNS